LSPGLLPFIAFCPQKLMPISASSSHDWPICATRLAGIKSNLTFKYVTLNWQGLERFLLQVVNSALSQDIQKLGIFQSLQVPKIPKPRILIISIHTASVDATDQRSEITYTPDTNHQTLFPAATLPLGFCQRDGPRAAGLNSHAICRRFPPFR